MMGWVRITAKLAKISVEEAAPRRSFHKGPAAALCFLCKENIPSVVFIRCKGTAILPLVKYSKVGNMTPVASLHETADISLAMATMPFLIFANVSGEGVRTPYLNRASLVQCIPMY